MPTDVRATQLLNRDLSTLEFNRRVLAQAEDTAMPLLERLKFLCIVSSNLDEFFEIRVAGLKEQIKSSSAALDRQGRSAMQVFQDVTTQAHALVARQYDVLNEVVLPALAKQGVKFLRRSAWSEAQRAWIQDYFEREVNPVLTPIGVDPAHPFPRVFNKSLNFVVELDGVDAFNRDNGIAIVQAPRVLPRVIRLPASIADAEYSFVFLTSVLHAHVGELFPGMRVRGCYQFRVTRNSDLFVDEEEVKNLRTTLQGELPRRHFGDAVRLEMVDTCSASSIEFLLQQLGLQREDLYLVNGPVNLVRLMQVPDSVDLPALKFPPFAPGLTKAIERRGDMFELLRKGDVLLHHPYQSFAPVVEFLQEAVEDPQVVAIKLTVYRTGTDSEIMEALITAAQNGKDVTVVVELMARFDEEANLNWAAKLEQVGAHVVYGVFGYKTHAKMLMVVRREENRLRRYVHLGTGNYHARTAKLYTDFSLLTCNPDIGQDVHEVFNQITGLGRAGQLRHLWQSPFSLHLNVIFAIRREAEHARAGKPAAIIAKLNALLEPAVITELYEASRAGVKIDLIVRGVCALRPGIAGLSENIRVRSIVGRFLEHSRVYCFANAGAEDVYLASADWMERNFFRRIEVCFPVLDPKLKKRVIDEAIRRPLADAVQAWEMDSDGHYERATGRRANAHSSQQSLLSELAVVARPRGYAVHAQGRAREATGST